MKTVKKVVCWICSKEYNELTEAKKCESKGIMLPCFKIGDEIKYYGHLGWEGKYNKDRIGIVIDILFPVIDRSIQHDYRVSYLVRVDKIKRDSFFLNTEEKYFDEKNIEFLQTIKEITVVDECDVYFEDGEGKIGYNYCKKRAIVTSWSDYVAEIERRNPQLKDRLAGLTKKFRELNYLD